MKGSINDSVKIDPDIKGARILVADDDALHRRIFADLIKNMGHNCLTVENGLEALEKIKTYGPDLIIMDVVMPGLDGYEVTRRLKEDPLSMHLPVVMVTSLSDRHSKIKGLEYGADEFLNKPVDETEFVVRIRNLLKVKRFEDYLMEHGRMLEGEVMSKAAQLERAFLKIKHGYIETIYRLTLAAEYRDKETGGHIRRMSLYCQMLARFLGLPEAQVEAIFFASTMHDVGKIGIPDSILLKPGPHTREEFEIMKTHTTIGARILHGSDSEILRIAEEIALTHHERWDGKGYPAGLRGEEIPISGRIVHISDIYDAIRSRRPYKDAIDHATACDIINNMEESFDPLILKGFNECACEFKRLFDENRDDGETPMQGLGLATG